MDIVGANCFNYSYLHVLCLPAAWGLKSVSSRFLALKGRNYLELSGPKYLQNQLVALADWEGGLHTYVGVKMDHGDLSPS